MKVFLKLNFIFMNLRMKTCRGMLLYGASGSRVACGETTEAPTTGRVLQQTLFQPGYRDGFNNCFEPRLQHAYVHMAQVHYLLSHISTNWSHAPGDLRNSTFLRMSFKAALASRSSSSHVLPPPRTRASSAQTCNGFQYNMK